MRPHLSLICKPIHTHTHIQVLKTLQNMSVFPQMRPHLSPICKPLVGLLSAYKGDASSEFKLKIAQFAANLTKDCTPELASHITACAMHRMLARFAQEDIEDAQLYAWRGLLNVARAGGSDVRKAMSDKEVCMFVWVCVCVCIFVCVCMFCVCGERQRGLLNVARAGSDVRKALSDRRCV